MNHFLQMNNLYVNYPKSSICILPHSNSYNIFYKMLKILNITNKEKSERSK